MASKGVLSVARSPGPASRRPRILAAVDFSAQSTIALGRAVAMADAYGGELHLVWVHDPGEPASPLDMAGSEDATRRLSEAAVSALLEAKVVSSILIHVLVGVPAAEIAWLAAHLDVDLIVVGTNARNGPSHFILGSVSEKVTRIAGCPVLVERCKRHEESWRVPDMDPLCAECRAHREQSGGLDLWCAEHASRHLQTRVHAAGPAGGVRLLPPGPAGWWQPSS